VSQLESTLSSGEAKGVVEEGFYDMAREVLRAFDAGETPGPLFSHHQKDMC
jgi:hypothetical protein